MIDTVQFRHQIPMPSLKGVQDRGFRRVKGQPYKWVWDYQVTGKTVPRLTWRSTEGGDWLTVEVSLPKLLYSSNVFPLTADDIREGLEMISEFVEHTAGVVFEASEALVGRVDYCHGFQVGSENMMPYLSAISRANYPNLPFPSIKRSSVTFSNKARSKEIQLYDKWEEMSEQFKEGKATEDQRDSALGFLRLEVRHRTSPACTRLATKHDQPNRTAKYLLSPDIAYREIEESLTALGLDRPIVAVDGRVDGIRKAFGDTPLCRRLLGFITLLDRYGEGFWKHGYGGYKKSKYHEEAKLLRGAGLWLYSEQPLPALQIEPFERLARAA